MPSVKVEDLRGGDMVDLEEDRLHLTSADHDPVTCACQFEYAVVDAAPTVSAEATTVEYGADGVYDYPHGYVVEVAHRESNGESNHA